MRKKLITDNEIMGALKGNDSIISAIVEQIGYIEIDLECNHFLSLVKIIIGQQLSNIVADRISTRFINKFGQMSLKEVYECDDDCFRDIGISKAKVKYIKNVIEAIMNGNIDFESFTYLSDEEIVASLTSIKGIGKWSAEMFLIFSMGREDVFSISDGGLQRATSVLYDINSRDKEIILSISDKWKPYRTYASLFLWETINRKII